MLYSTCLWQDTIAKGWLMRTACGIHHHLLSVYFETRIGMFDWKEKNKTKCEFIMDSILVHPVENIISFFVIRSAEKCLYSFSSRQERAGKKEEEAQLNQANREMWFD